MPEKTQQKRQILERLTEVLWSMPFKQAELSRKLGISESYLSKIKSGKVRLTRKMAARIGEVAGVEGDWILTGQPPKLMREAEPAYAIRGQGNGRGPVTRHFCHTCLGEIGLTVEECPHCEAQIDWSQRR